MACHGVMLWVSRPQRRPQYHEGPPEVAADIKTFVVAVQHDDTAALKLGLPVQLSEHHDDACRIARDSRIVMNQGQKQLTIPRGTQQPAEGCLSQHLTGCGGQQRQAQAAGFRAQMPAVALPGSQLDDFGLPLQPAMPARVPEQCPSATCTAGHAATSSQQCPVSPQACPGADCTEESLVLPGLCTKHGLHFQHESHPSCMPHTAQSAARAPADCSGIVRTSLWCPSSAEHPQAAPECLHLPPQRSSPCADLLPTRALAPKAMGGQPPHC